MIGDHALQNRHEKNAFVLLLPHQSIDERFIVTGLSLASPPQPVKPKGEGDVDENYHFSF